MQKLARSGLTFKQEPLIRAFAFYLLPFAL
jgi:hypothetical protein